MKAYKLPTLSAYYQHLLELVIHDGGNDSGYLSKSQYARVSPVYNRLRKNPVWQEIAQQNNIFQLLDFAKHITNGEIIASPDTFLWYLLDRYEDRMSMSIYQAAEDADCIRWNLHDLTYWLNGLSIKYPTLIHFSNTHDLGAIWFQRPYNKQFEHMNANRKQRNDTIADVNDDNNNAVNIATDATTAINVADNNSSATNSPDPTNKALKSASNSTKGVLKDNANTIKNTVAYAVNKPQNNSP